MRKVYGLQILDSGTYYTSQPQVFIDPPEFDSGRYGGEIDSSVFKFGCGSLKHDSNDLTTLKEITDSAAGTNQFAMQSFWFYLDSLEPCTLAWHENFRIYVNNNNNLAITYSVDSSNKDAFQTENVQVRTTQSLFVQANQWHFAKIETNQTALNSASLRIGLDGAYAGTYVSNPNFYFFDSGDIIRLGYDSGYTAPEHKENVLGQYVIDSDINKSFTGNIDDFQFVIAKNKLTYDNTWSNWVPDSTGNTYEDSTPLVEEHWDYKTAKGKALIDSAKGEVSALILLDSGCGYGDSQEVGITFGAASTIDSDYRIGDDIYQTLSNGTKMRGEVTHYVLDSDGDSCRKLRLTHVGADDGEFSNFIIGESNGSRIINTSRGAGNTGLQVTSIKELNNISKNEQNDQFSDESDDFLDFSETNPFGDPEDQ